MFLRVTPTIGIGRALRAKKLSPKFIGPFQILEKVGPVAYRVALPPSLSNLHNVFHVSQLRRYIPNPYRPLNHESVQVKSDLTYQPFLVQMLDRAFKSLRNRSIPMVKILWDGSTPEEATWEMESEIIDKFPYLFQ